MAIGIDGDALEGLPGWFREALYTSATVLIEQYFDDLAAFERADFAQTAMYADLPRAYLPRYDAGFGRRFVTCLLTVVWKLRAPEVYQLACVAEEMALYAIIQQARGLVDIGADH